MIKLSSASCSLCAYYSRKLKVNTDGILAEVDAIAAENKEIIEGRLWE